MPEPETQGSVRPTGWQTVAIAAIVGASLGWLGCALPDGLGWALPSPPWIASALVGVAALGVGFLAWSTHVRLHVRREKVLAERAVRLLVLGKATLLVGAAMAGGYVAMIVFVVERTGVELLSPRVMIAGSGVIAGILLAIAGAFLQWACRIPGPPRGDATPSQLPGSPVSPD